MDEAADYPAHWEADVVLSDGATAHLRPIAPADAQRLVEFYARVSDQSKYYRFFAPYPTLTNRDIERFTRVDHRDRVALILLIGDDMIAVGRYERLDRTDAEVSFLVEDGHQGRGVGSVLLEHLAQVARERGVRRFVADILPANRKMITVFADAGYTVDNSYEDGVVHVEFEIAPTGSSLEVMAAREHRAEARSIERLLTPRSVAVIGASRWREKIGQTLVRNLVLGGFTGPVYAVNREATAITGLPAYKSVRDVPGEIDLALVAVPADAVADVVLDCAAKGVRGLVVVSSGFAETGEPVGRSRQAELVRLARAHGMRIVGPNCLGIVNTDPDYSLNASLATTLPPAGKVGFFAQSGALGSAILGDGAARGLGVSTFVSAGNRADVSGNDLLQYWRDDPATEVVLLYLESLGNPRKFSRLSRAVAEVKPVVAVKSGRSTQGVPLGHTVRPIEAPADALDAMFRQSGVILVDTIPEMFDVAQVLAFQPLPTGRTVAVMGNSGALCLLAADAAVSAGLDVYGDPVGFGAGATADDYRKALRAFVDEPAVSSVLVVYAPAVDGPGGDDVATALAEVAAGAGKPVVTTFQGQRGVRGPAGVPSYPSPEEAARALGHATAYAEWRRRSHGKVPRLEGCDAAAARKLARAALSAPDADPQAGVDLDPAQLRELLATYGVDLLPMVAAPTLDAALAALGELGGEVVLKATSPRLRHRPDLAAVWRNIDTVDEMRDAWATMARTLPDPAEAGFVVQPMAPGGVPVTIRAWEDPMFGPVVSFGVSGVASELLGDRSYRIPPLTDRDAAEMVREVKAAALLMGYHGGIMADLSAVEDLVHRMSRLVDDVPEVGLIELDPVLAGESGLAVVNGSARVAAPAGRQDWYTRRLP
ncbi:bifunctional acetate--CoA ligase family protein/GNAT family N-acetyltransferase [Jiangella rhizosphaerae]|uniref:GNAT family N-acetyltransferase n=1 Tax=Jiangella rhizosphaerae TaxID=2293569 RepID=A0A418KVC2_9ACTN|nr:bifunctional GNAT family N-acetyltransferase/acetate--CoA ligase family protein [Jiangella rhizosphaerae]RIQ32124.1 GNAT family N-acetyltransferase [Jiangella rhizosphaerae]